MFWRFVLAAVRLRRRRLLLAFAALAVAATLATALFSVYTDIERKMRAEFRGLGANLILAPEGDAQSISLAGIAEAERLGAAAAPFLYTVVRLNGEPVVVAGVDFGHAAPLTAYWRVEGSRSAGEGECLAGATLAAHFHLTPGKQAGLAGAPCIIRGIVTTGGDEDARLMVPFATAGRLAGLEDRASLIQVRAAGERLAQVRSTLARLLPNVDVRELHAVAETEANVVLKVRAVLFLLTALILAITTLCVTSNFSALVLERSKEIGILKAIGAAERKIAALFLSESLLLGLGSTIVGYGVGLL
ncbi:MAG TPA: ABC transporter permease, partial [Bryobacteraceae bacterium]|nr:ABC transporter permease [Bryobacteraceae bacterium]